MLFMKLYKSFFKWVYQSLFRLSWFESQLSTGCPKDIFNFVQKSTKKATFWSKIHYFVNVARFARKFQNIAVRLFLFGHPVRFIRNVNVKGVYQVNLVSLKFALRRRAIKNALSCSYQKSMCYNLQQNELKMT